jgi:serine/threonine-protein kinase RsbW
MTPDSNQDAMRRIPDFEFKVQSGALAVREALGRFLKELEPLNLDVEEIGTVELVLAEILNNIVEHAYPDSGPSGPIAIHCVHKADGLRVLIRDVGKSMPDGKMPLGELSSHEVEFDDLPEGGFGWFLIQHLAKDVTYKRVGNENRLKMRLAVGYGV